MDGGITRKSGARCPGGHVRTRPNTPAKAHAQASTYVEAGGRTGTRAPGRLVRTRASPLDPARRQTGTREHAGKHTRASTCGQAGSLLSARGPRALRCPRTGHAWPGGRRRSPHARARVRPSSRPLPRSGNPGPLVPCAAPMGEFSGLERREAPKTHPWMAGSCARAGPGAQAHGRAGTQAGAHGRARVPRPRHTRRQAPRWRRACGRTPAGGRKHARGRAPARSRAPSARRCPRAGRAWPGARRRSPRARGRVRCWARHPSPPRPAPPRSAPTRGRARG